jgi:hypothetical protein
VIVISFAEVLIILNIVPAEPFDGPISDAKLSAAPLQLEETVKSTDPSEAPATVSSTTVVEADKAQ